MAIKGILIQDNCLLLRLDKTLKLITEAINYNYKMSSGFQNTSRVEVELCQSVSVERQWIGLLS